MPIEIGVWRIDRGLQQVEPTRLAEESRLEDILHQDIRLVRGDLWVIGRQVPTSFGHFVDLLAIDATGALTVVELKRHRTPRDVVAQALDYGSWVGRLSREEIVRIYDDFARRYPKSGAAAVPFEAAFSERFGGPPPEALNESHELVIVAAELDESTERIVRYLSEYGVPVNAAFFRVFRDGDREYLTRVWLRDPSEAQAETEEAQARQHGKEPWNGSDFYASFQEDRHRNWEDARAYGFISAGGGAWYTRTLRRLQPGHRVFVHAPEKGYVGVGRVVQAARRAEQFEVMKNGEAVALSSLALKAEMLHDAASDDLAETLVGVEWLRTVPLEKAIWKNGLFANQNSACKLRSRFTIEHLMQAFGLEET